jgi:hypothetical protein
MMRTAKKVNALAPGQYGSRRNHQAADLAINKALTFDFFMAAEKECSFLLKRCKILL